MENVKCGLLGFIYNKKWITSTGDVVEFALAMDSNIWIVMCWFWMISKLHIDWQKGQIAINRQSARRSQHVKEVNGVPGEGQTTISERNGYFDRFDTQEW